jgi:hypothetical protein
MALLPSLPLRRGSGSLLWPQAAAGLPAYPLDALSSQIATPARDLTLTPARHAHVRRQIFAGSFGGATLYDNPDYVSPNAVRASIKRKVGSVRMCEAVGTPLPLSALR